MDENRMVPYIIGISGGTGSGKSTLTRKILEQVPRQMIDVLRHDCYYRDLSHLPDEVRWSSNFDHPDALETELLMEHLEALRLGEPIEEPTYDFARNRRGHPTRRVEPRPVLLVEGILILADARLRKYFDQTVFVDAPPDIRLARRLQRDPVERNLPMEYVVKQYLETVRPMHEAFVEPSRCHADLILSGETHEQMQEGLASLLQMIEQRLIRNKP